MSESLALPSAGSQLLLHPQPHTRTCAHAHAHGAVTRARSHARPPCPSSPSPPRLQAAIRALHCGSCLQVGGASAPPPPPPAFPFCSGSLGRTEPGRRGPLRARPRAWGPRAPGRRRGRPGGPLHPPSRLGPSSSRSGHGVGGKCGRPICPGALPGGGWGRGRLRLLHARDPRTGTALPVATATLWNEAPFSESSGRDQRRTCLPAEPTIQPRHRFRRSRGLPGPGGRGAVTCQPALPDPKLPAPCAPAAATGEDPEASTLDRGCWERKTAPPPRATGWIKPERGAPLRPRRPAPGSCGEQGQGVSTQAGSRQPGAEASTPGEQTAKRDKG